MAKNCDFGKEIKKKLVDIDRTQAWLIEKVREETGGMYIDDSYLYRIMKGDAKVSSTRAVSYGSLSNLRLYLSVPIFRRSESNIVESSRLYCFGKSKGL